MKASQVVSRILSNRYGIGLAAAAGWALVPALAHAQVIADWTFETSQPSTAGPFAPETGAGQASGSHASSAAVYSTPAGNGSPHSFSSNNWSVGDYYQFVVSTAGEQDISLTFDQTSSNTGPRDFQVEYSTDGTDFTNFGSVYSVLADASPNTPWSSAGADQSVYTTADDLSSITALNGAANVYFRLVDTDTTSANAGAVGTGGTDRVDNVVVQGTAVVPEPASAALLAVVALGGLGRRSRRRNQAGI